jgi:hypothetical protein
LPSSGEEYITYWKYVIGVFAEGEFERPIVIGKERLSGQALSLELRAREQDESETFEITYGVKVNPAAAVGLGPGAKDERKLFVLLSPTEAAEMCKQFRISLF